MDWNGIDLRPDEVLLEGRSEIPRISTGRVLPVLSDGLAESMNTWHVLAELVQVSVEDSKGPHEDGLRSAGVGLQLRFHFSEAVDLIPVQTISAKHVLVSNELGVQGEDQGSHPI